MSVEPPPRPFPGPASSAAEDENAKLGFTVTSLTHLALGISLLLQPKNVAEYLLGPSIVDHDRLLGLLASSLLASSSSAWACQSLAESRQLETNPTAERLQLGLIGLGAIALSTQLFHQADLTNNGLGAAAAVSALTLGVPTARMLTTERGRRRLGSRIAGILDSVGNLFTFRRGITPTSGLYSILTPAFIAAGAAYFLYPTWTLNNIMGYATTRNSESFLWKNIGTAMLTILPAITYSLKEKADNDALADSESRALNIGLLLASAGHLAVLGPIQSDGTGGKYLTAGMGLWAAAGLASLLGLSGSVTDKTSF